jgi:hypothetical protein
VPTANNYAIVDFTGFRYVRRFLVEVAIANSVGALKNLFRVSCGTFVITLTAVAGPSRNRRRPLPRRPSKRVAFRPENRGGKSARSDLVSRHDADNGPFTILLSPDQKHPRRRVNRTSFLCFRLVANAFVFISRSATLWEDPPVVKRKTRNATYQYLFRSTGEFSAFAAGPLPLRIRYGSCRDRFNPC